jgi:hypothetical protein
MIKYYYMKLHRRARRGLVGIALAFVIVLSSCGPRIIGYAVILWPDPELPFSAGEIIPVVQTSQLQNSVTLYTDGQEQRFPAWRVEYVDSEAAGRDFLLRFEPWRERYGRSMLTALPVRALADRTSTRLYRLRDGEVIKLIDRTDEQSNEAGLIDYWYNVMTEDGTRGWVFGRNLEILTSSGRVAGAVEAADRVDRFVQDIARVPWRPDYFREMHQSGRIQLDRFNPRYGFFGDEQENTFRLSLPDIERTFQYRGYSMPRGNTIQFDGTSLTIIRHSEDRIEVQYLVDERQRSSSFVIFDPDIDETITIERERREDQLLQMTMRGTGLVSTAFGSIDLNERGQVRWQGYERLVPTVLPSMFNGSGSFEFSLFIHNNLRARYDGAFQLVIPGAAPVAFLYTITDDGLRLVYVPQREISDQKLIREEPVSPVVLFFRFIAE